MEEEKEKKLFHRCDGEGSQGEERSGEELSLFQLLSSLISLSTSFTGRVEEQKEAGRRPPPKMKICHFAREKTLHGFRAATSPKKPLKSSKLLFRTRDVGLSPELVFRAYRRYQEHSISLRALPTVCNFPSSQKLLDISRSLPFAPEDSSKTKCSNLPSFRSVISCTRRECMLQ